MKLKKPIGAVTEMFHEVGDIAHPYTDAHVREQPSLSPRLVHVSPEKRANKVSSSRKCWHDLRLPNSKSVMLRTLSKLSTEHLQQHKVLLVWCTTLGRTAFLEFSLAAFGVQSELMMTIACAYNSRSCCKLSVAMPANIHLPTVQH